MNAFVSWSGGKDSMFALYTFLKESNHKVKYLVNFCNAEDQNSGSHKISKTLLQKQAQCLSIPLIQEPLTDVYETHLKKVIAALKNEGIDTGVFGDIYLQEHRTWLTRVCSEAGIKAEFPLWGKDTKQLITDFIDAGFRTLIIAVKDQTVTNTLLGRELDRETLDYLLQHKDTGIDPCGENGEYHTFVFDGPIFNTSVSFTIGKAYSSDNNLYLPIYLQ